MYRVLAPTLPSHFRIALAVNSGPLSERMCASTPLLAIKPDKVTITSLDLTCRFVLMARHSLVYSYMTVGSLTALSSWVLIRTKS